MTYAGKYNRDPSPTRLYRDPANGHLMGVCAGIADYFDISPSTVRVIAVISLVFFTVPTAIAYFAAGMMLEAKPATLYASREQEDFWREMRTEPVHTASNLKHKFRDIERRIREAEAYVTSSEFKLNRDISNL
ncbi:MAG: hypothetical protein A3G18_00410 [Rhodospirillales bacterium RIFCSPLOWO2_12_FULL_58_28]|nr:MAG: hypothetical protein A3H92_03015 [Rhodospirillales bacterium RIFCSPLOWO2_02_FULL_58_16]OHC79925.1 MAG: hypothetical protein A3G18_00410 [Rhodospirillales bacterium RIFCSPLOWO2_12_FULL_58_28]